jgi:hypothetical protein
MPLHHIIIKEKLEKACGLAAKCCYCAEARYCLPKIIQNKKLRNFLHLNILRLYIINFKFSYCSFHRASCFFSFLLFFLAIRIFSPAFTHRKHQWSPFSTFLLNLYLILLAGCSRQTNSSSQILQIGTHFLHPTTTLRR